MKHLNPRQGITTDPTTGDPIPILPPARVKHLNPRQGITTYRSQSGGSQSFSGSSVKHLNPRQGITTAAYSEQMRHLEKQAV